MRAAPEVFATVKAAIEDTDAEHVARYRASRRAASSVRKLIELMRERSITEDEFAALADEIDSLSARLERADRSPRLFEDAPMAPGDERWTARFEYGLNGRSTVARPEFSVVIDDTTVTGTLTFGLANEGTVPGVTTGPWIAYVFDLVLAAAGVSNSGAVTRDLSISYRRPVPTMVPLAVRARVDESDARSNIISGEILHGDKVLVEARATTVDPAAPRAPATERRIE